MILLFGLCDMFMPSMCESFVHDFSICLSSLFQGRSFQAASDQTEQASCN